MGSEMCIRDSWDGVGSAMGSESVRLFWWWHSGRRSGLGWVHNIGIFLVRLGEFMLGSCEVPLVCSGLHSMGFWVCGRGCIWRSWLGIGWLRGKGVAFLVTAFNGYSLSSRCSKLLSRMKGSRTRSFAAVCFVCQNGPINDFIVTIFPSISCRYPTRSQARDRA